MNRTEAIEKYTALGLEIEEGCDEAGCVYKPHKHETTYLYTTHGSIRIKKGAGEWKKYITGDECIIADGETHEAIVGTEGWTYVAGWNKQEAEKYDVA